MYRESKIANFSPISTIVTMKLGSNAQSATNYIRITFEPYKAISARDIEPSPYEFKNSQKNIFWKSAFFILLLSRSPHCYIPLKFDGNPSPSCAMPGAQSFQHNRKWTVRQNSSFSEKRENSQTFWKIFSQIKFEKIVPQCLKMLTRKSALG